MVDIDKIYDSLTDILEYIDSTINYNNPSERYVLHNIATMILLVQEMIENDE